MAKKPDTAKAPPTPDRQGIDPGTWLWIVGALLATLAVVAWAAWAGLPGGRR